MHMHIQPDGQQLSATIWLMPAMGGNVQSSSCKWMKRLKIAALEHRSDLHEMPHVFQPGKVQKDFTINSPHSDV